MQFRQEGRHHLCEVIPSSRNAVQWIAVVFCETPVFLPNCAHDATGAPTDRTVEESAVCTCFYREGHRHLCCHAEAEPTEANDSEYAGGLPVRHSETPTFQREGERSFSDHTETDAAHPEDKTVEISCAIL